MKRQARHGLADRRNRTPCIQGTQSFEQFPAPCAKLMAAAIEPGSMAGL